MCSSDLGAILPIEPLVESSEETPSGPLKLRVFPGPDCKGSLYQDDGTSFAYKSGAFLRIGFTCATSPDGRDLTVHVGAREGSYPAWWKSIQVEVDGVSSGPARVTGGGHEITASAQGGNITVDVPDDGKGLDVRFALSTTAP